MPSGPAAEQGMKMINTFRRVTGIAMCSALLLAGAVGCSDDDEGSGTPAADTTVTPSGLTVAVDPDEETAPAEFDVRPGTREVTVTGVEPEQRVSLVDSDGDRLVVLKADRHGQAHFAYLGNELLEFQTGAKAKLPTSEGRVVEAGAGYTIRNEDADPVQVSEPFEVAGRDDHPEPDFFDEQSKDLVPEGDETEMFGYVTTRDGAKLSVMVRLPGPVDEGPYPTVIEYSGYGPSDPGHTEPGSMIAGILGYATVGVNMRGTGCSGGVFDVFNTAQQTDGYDAIEAIARQPWVEHNRVGMVGLSYSGITQLYAAATAPPSLAAIAPMSVIKDPWLQQWPGGVYNGGFTRQWLEERDRQSAVGGTTWVQKRIDEGDENCIAHQDLREQNIDFQAFGQSLVRRPPLADERDLSKLIRDIEVPVFLTGAWQDEQTGPQFADMLGNFDSAPLTRFTLFNGRHPDGYTPLLLSRWYEFLELYVHEEVPKLNDGIRAAAPTVFADYFGIEDLSFEEDRFPDLGPGDFDEALARYEAEPDVRVLFEMGGDPGSIGTPAPSFEQTYDTWPPSDLETLELHLAADGALVSEAPGEDAADEFANDPESGSKSFFTDDYELLSALWDFDWSDFDEGDAVAYVSEPFEETTVLGGPGQAEIHLQVPDGDADVQVTLSKIDGEGTEWHVTTGLLRLSDRKVADDASDGLRIERTYSPEDAEDMPDGYEAAKVAIPSFAEPFRAGDRLKVAISSPGRDFGAWTFETTGEDGTPRRVGRGGAIASTIRLGILPGITDVPDLTSPCPSLRGQACRPYEPRTNVGAEEG